MHVDLETVRRVFEGVLSGSISGEQADRWAYTVVQQEETGAVTYSPPLERERIWAGVMYLYGVDTMTAPGEYLHSDNDVSEAMNTNLGEIADSKVAMLLRVSTTKANVKSKTPLETCIC